MSKFAWTFVSSTLFLVKSLYAVESRPARISFKKDLKVLKKKYNIDTGFTHLNFFHNDSFSSSYFTVSPKISTKSFKLDSFAWFSANEGGNETFSVRELYYTTEFFSTNLHIGRRIHEWTKEEDLKPTGFWNNAWDFNKSDPQLEGNIGLFIEKNFNSKNKLNVFISPLSLPKFVSHNEIRQQGDVVGNTPWSLTPPNQVDYSGLNLPVNYALDEIDYVDLISALQVGASYDYEGDTAFFKSSYLFGPSKDLDMGLDFILDSTDQSTPVEISILPQSYNVHRLGLDFGFKWSSQSVTGLSVNHRERERGLIDDPRQSFIGLSSGSVFQLYHKESLMKDKVRLTAFINENTQITNQSNGELGELLESYLSVPFRFVRGGGLKIESLLSDKAEIFVMAYYDVEQEGVLARLRIESNFIKRFKAQIGFDVVEALNDQAEGFYRDFRENDFIYGGVSYVF
jgi:hypothetical protein